MLVGCCIWGKRSASIARCASKISPLFIARFLEHVRILPQHSPVYGVLAVLAHEPRPWALISADMSEYGFILNQCMWVNYGCVLYAHIAQCKCLLHSPGLRNNLQQVHGIPFPTRALGHNIVGTFVDGLVAMPTHGQTAPP